MGNQFFFLASFFWVACIAWHIHSTIVAQRHADPQRPAPCLQFLRFHCISWGLPLASVVVLAVIDEPEFGFDHSYDPEGEGGQLAWVSQVKSSPDVLWPGFVSAPNMRLGGSAGCGRATASCCSTRRCWWSCSSTR